MIMCLVPYTVTCITEIQFIAYMHLLKNRLKFINDFFVQFRRRENLKSKNFNMKECQAVNEMFLVREIRDKIKIRPSSDEKQKNINKVKLQAFVESIIESRKLGSKQLTDNVLINGLLNEKIMKMQTIYTDLEKFLMLIRSAYCVQVITIFTMKFSILTSMLYACCMILIKYESPFKGFSS